MRQKQSPKRLTIAEVGRDGGGSLSGAPSRCGSGASGDGPSFPPVRTSMAMALHGELPEGHGTSPHRARADALGDQSDVDDESTA